MPDWPCREHNDNSTRAICLADANYFSEKGHTLAKLYIYCLQGGPNPVIVAGRDCPIIYPSDPVFGLPDREGSSLPPQSVPSGSGSGAINPYPSLLSPQHPPIGENTPSSDDSDGQHISKLITVVGSSDPNDKRSPTGVGTERFILTDQPIEYTINYENVVTATAAVQELLVIDQLHPELDYDTFRFTEIVYSDYVIPIAGTSPYSLSLLDQPPTGILTGTAEGVLAVEVDAFINTIKGEVTWYLKLIDTATGGFPEDPFAGFLPPEDGTGRGLGHVRFSVKPKPDISSGTVITNSAVITFDYNEPIVTNVVSNTIVAQIPLTVTLHKNQIIYANQLILRVLLCLLPLIIATVAIYFQINQQTLNDMKRAQYRH